jgi:hypothetical protein
LRQVEQRSVVTLCLRRAIALPVYTVALLLDYLSAALGRLAAWVAGDDWP